jgi:hypothetical protein
VTEGADLAALRHITIAAQSEALAVSERPLSYPVYGETLSLEQLVEGLMPGRPLAVSGNVSASALPPFLARQTEHACLSIFPAMFQVRRTCRMYLISSCHPSSFLTPVGLSFSLSETFFPWSRLP